MSIWAGDRLVCLAWRWLLLLPVCVFALFCTALPHASRKSSRHRPLLVSKAPRFDLEISTSLSIAQTDCEQCTFNVESVSQLFVSPLLQLELISTCAATNQLVFSLANCISTLNLGANCCAVCLCPLMVWLQSCFYIEMCLWLSNYSIHKYCSVYLLWNIINA